MSFIKLKLPELCTPKPPTLKTPTWGVAQNGHADYDILCRLLFFLWGGGRAYAWKPRNLEALNPETLSSVNPKP